MSEVVYKMCACYDLSICAGETQMVECSTTLNCSLNGTLMSARECCVNSEEGLAYTIPGNNDKCHTCFGMFMHHASE